MQTEPSVATLGSGLQREPATASAHAAGGIGVDGHGGGSSSSAASLALDVEAVVAALATDYKERPQVSLDRVCATLLLNRGASVEEAVRKIADSVGDEAEAMTFVAEFSRLTRDAELAYISEIDALAAAQPPAQPPPVQPSAPEVVPEVAGTPQRSQARPAPACAKGRETPW